MTYTTIATPALIIDAHDRGESSRVIILLTPGLGLVRAHVQGVRELRSKQRSHLSGLSLLGVTLIRGREVWRLGSVEENDVWHDVRGEKDKRRIVVHLVSLIKKFIHGEEPLPALFHDMIRGISFLNEVHTTTRNLKRIETVLVLRLMYHLGYIAQSENFSRALKNDVWEDAHFFDTDFIHDSRTIGAINASFAASGM